MANAIEHKIWDWAYLKPVQKEKQWVNSNA